MHTVERIYLIRLVIIINMMNRMITDNVNRSSVIIFFISPPSNAVFHFFQSFCERL